MSNAAQNELGSVVSLWRYPVKSMMGEELNDGESGLVFCYLLAIVLLGLNHGSSSQSRISRRLIPYDLAP